VTSALFVVLLLLPWANATFLMAIITLFAWIAAVAVRPATHQRRIAQGSSAGRSGSPDPGPGTRTRT
jgi:hypothetical protein